MSASGMLALKAWQLKYWAFLTGAPTTGTKTELLAVLLRNLEEAPTRRKGNVVSVDMGIRNLAFCAIEAPPMASNTNELKIKITAWKRMDLLRNNNVVVECPDVDDSQTSGDKRQKTAVATQSFTPAILSRTALDVSQELLSHQPGTILIEQQRFRSGGAAAIQEWTVRVNMLESMLWACLRTLGSTSQSPEHVPDLHAVNPTRVANFWSSPASISLHPPSLFSGNDRLQHMIMGLLKTAKMDKRDKVNTVRSWVAGKPGILLEFSDEAKHIATAFSLEPNQLKDSKVLAGGKLDDLADCLLQAVAWVKWKDNELILGDLWRKAVAGVADDTGS